MNLKKMRNWRVFNSLKAVVGMLIITIVILIAFFPDHLSPFDPYGISPLERLQNPNAKYLFGTDDLGRDVFSRTIYAFRLSLQIAFFSTFITVLFGIILGGLSGFYSKLDNILMRLVDLFMCFPQLLVAILTIIVLGRNITSLSIAIGLTFTPSMARLVRSKVLSIKNEEYIKAAKSIGRSTLSILIRHVIPNTFSEIIVQGTVTLGFAILIESGLSYIGLGAPPPQASWGRMISDAQGFLEIAPHMILAPGFALLFTVIGFNLLGDGLRDILDPKIKYYKIKK